MEILKFISHGLAVYRRISVPKIRSAFSIRVIQPAGFRTAVTMIGVFAATFLWGGLAEASRSGMYEQCFSYNPNSNPPSWQKVDNGSPGCPSPGKPSLYQGVCYYTTLTPNPSEGANPTTLTLPPPNACGAGGSKCWYYPQNQSLVNNSGWQASSPNATGCVRGNFNVAPSLLGTACFYVGPTPPANAAQCQWPTCWAYHQNQKLYPGWENSGPATACPGWSNSGGNYSPTISSCAGGKCCYYVGLSAPSGGNLCNF